MVEERLTPRCTGGEETILTLVLSSLFRRTNDVFITHNIKFADDTTVLGLIRNNDESAYREEVQHCAAWCASNNLVLGTKTKELIDKIL